MKLYTEEQVKTAILQTFLACKITIHERYKNCENCECDILETLKPIELPSDEIVEQEADISSSLEDYSKGFAMGAYWILKKIKQQDIGH